ncbi:MAG: FHA domain-containing protein [Solirubrobacteraceae bacterium]
MVLAALEPASVALKFGFVAVLFLFLLWVARSSMKDLRRVPGQGGGSQWVDDPVVGAEETGLHSSVGPKLGDEPRLIVERAPGHEPGSEYDLHDGAVLGRGDKAEIRLEDPFASSRHAQISRQGGVMVLEDLGSTNGTYLNEEVLGGPTPLHPGDRVRIGDSEFTFTA